jgi:hypothetical protein
MSPTPLPRVISLEQTCTACPSQWEGGLEGGGYVYIRYRWGALSVGIGPSEEEFWGDPSKRRCLKDINHGDAFDGHLTTEEMRALCADVLDFSTLVEVKSGE